MAFLVLWAPVGLVYIGLSNSQSSRRLCDGGLMFNQTPVKWCHTTAPIPSTYTDISQPSCLSRAVHHKQQATPPKTVKGRGARGVNSPLKSCAREYACVETLHFRYSLTWVVNDIQLRPMYMLIMLLKQEESHASYTSAYGVAVHSVMLPHAKTRGQKFSKHLSLADADFVSGCVRIPYWTRRV